MLKLLKGIHDFQATYFEPQRLLFERLARGQNPETLFITCSDSRILVSQLTGSGPGEMFVSRNTGNIIPPYSADNGSEAATIEYAVAVLGVKEIIICGHSHCGAVQALLGPEPPANVPAVSRWLRYAEATRRIVKEKYAELPPDQQINVGVQENVLVQLENLRTHPSVAAALARGALHLHGWVYKLEAGQVFAYQPQSGSFELITEAHPVAVPAERLANERPI